MKKIFSPLFLLTLLLMGCKNNSDSNLVVKSTNFPKIIAVTPQIIEFPAIMAVRDWNITNQSLICKSRHTDYFFYEFSLSDFTLKDSFCVHGQGSEEFLFPEMLVMKENKRLIVDNGKKKIYSYENNKIEKVASVKTLDIMSSVKEYAYPIIGYKTHLPNELVWKLVDIEKGITLDSILFVDEDKKGQAFAKYDFEWDFDGNKLFMASRKEDNIKIYSIDNNKVTEQCIWKGNEGFESTYTYTAIDCSLDKVYLLSQKEENSEVEIYTKHGEPTCLLKLGLPVVDMLLDEGYNRLLLLTANEELGIINLP